MRLAGPYRVDSGASTALRARNFPSLLNPR